jgi:membrane protein DedA with SNARE-associated domain
MMFRRSSTTVLAWLVLLACLGYFGLIAAAPAVLHGDIAGWPRSILLALLLFLLFFAVTLWHIRTQDREPAA